MANLNKVFLIGNLTRDPELKYTPKGTAVASFALAINHVYKTPDGEKREEVSFIDVTAFGRQAEVVSEYVKKGDPFFVEGRLKLETWDDKQSGQKRSKLRVLLESFQFLASRGGKSGQESGGAGEYDDPPQRPPQRPPAGRQPPSRDPDLDPQDDDIPF